MTMPIDISQMPTSVLTDCARNELFEIISKYQSVGLPAYIIEGVLSEALADIRQLRAKEVVDGYASMMEAMQSGTEEETDSEEVE